ncbi:unnamed protein product [Mytilus coruscus]|uniref:C2H2-type domain-containing protein n=1 Tax=Mytilus coruscus TaxID=42192 RepID=A0A6J8BBQ7_MYTCO|nr:unnamed protein product [Mytilus coruscus]
MAQAYINHVFSNGDNLTENQIRELRCELASKNEFSDCDEDLLVQTADEIEKVYYSENKKRKRDLKENISNKKTKLDSKFICDLCDKVFKHAYTLDRHLQAHFLRNTCTTCKKSFTRKSNLKRHEQNNKKKSGLTCNHCGIPFDNYDDLFHHVSANHPLNQSGGHKDTTAIEDTVSAVKDNKKDSKSNKKRFHFRKTALNKTVNQTSIIPYANEKYDLLQFLANTKQDVDNELTRRRAEQRNIKWYVNARVEMVRDVDEGNQYKAQPHFRSKNYISLSDENNDHNLNEAFQSVNRSLEEFINKGSNWILNKIISLEIHTVPYSPIAGSSYMKLPTKLCGTGGIINIKNGDQNVFGKCMENLRERFNLSLIHSEEKLKKFVSKPSFERIQIFNEDLVGVQNKQVNLILNKPIYAGQVILDLSKQLMYEFHYKVIKPMYGDNVNLLFTDTDSLCYEVKTDDIYKDRKTIHNLLDTSNYEEGHPLYSNTNKKVPGKMKDELGGIPIKEAIMMRPKMYSITYAETRVDENGDIITSEKEKKVAKGIVKCEIKKDLTSCYV